MKLMPNPDSNAAQMANQVKLAIRDFHRTIESTLVTCREGLDQRHDSESRIQNETVSRFSQ